MSQQLVISIPLKSIDVSDRLRAVDNAGAAKLAASMEADGKKRLIQPITVRPKNGGYKLVAGAHRVAAAKLLGWTEIDAIVEAGLTENEARIREIDENLHRQELTPYDQAEFLTMRWRLWLQQKDKRKTLPNLLELSERNENAEFYQETAGLAGLHPETIRLAVRRRRQLDVVWELLRGTDAAGNGALLDRLRKKFKDDMDKVVAQAPEFGNSVEQAMNARAAQSPGSGKKSVSAANALKDLEKAWRACPEPRREAFVKAHAEELIALLKLGKMI